MANFQVTAGTLLEDFSSLTNWSQSTGTTTIETSSQFIKNGTGSFKMSAAANNTCIITKTVSWDLSKNNVHGIWVYLIDPAANVSSIDLYMSNDSSFTNYFNTSLTNTNSKFTQGWNYFTILKRDWTTNAAADWNSTIIRFRVRLSASVANAAIAYYDSYFTNPYSRPKILYTFDDVIDTCYTIGYPYMKARGIKGTAYAAGGFIDTAGYMTTAQLRTLQDDGWLIGNHTYNHTNLTTLSIPDMVTEIGLQDKWMAGRGFTDGIPHFAYPNGGNSDDTVTAMRQVGTKFTARNYSIGTRIYQPHVFGIENPYQLKAVGVFDTTTLTYAKASVDDTITHGGTAFFVFHKFVAGAPATGIEWKTQDFYDLTDYINAKRDQLDFVTVKEWWDGLSKPRRKA